MNNDVKIAHPETNSTRTTQSIEIMQTEITSRVTLNIAVNESDTRYQKSNQIYNLSHQIEMTLKRRRFDCKQYLIDCQDVETR